MKYVLCLFIWIVYIPSNLAQDNFYQTPTIKIRKRVTNNNFSQALQLPQTATSCDCPDNSSNNNPLLKLGCQHPDTSAVCKVVITQFDLAVIPENGEALVIKDIKGSFLDRTALNFMRSRYGNKAFVSYSNIKGMTSNGKEVVVPSFGSQNPAQRASRAYYSIYNYITSISTETKIESFELLAYNTDNKMIFRQQYHKDYFDKNAIRPDAVRYVFKEIQAVHSSGVNIEIDNFETNNLEIATQQFLSSHH